MKRYRHNLLLLLLPLLLLQACKEDDIIYDVNQEELLPPSANKTKLKTTEQYLAIMHANLFQQALPSNELVELTNLVESVGDKEVIHEIIISNFMNEGDVIVPTDAEMRADIDLFVEETYHRFYVRSPTEAEKTWFKNYIEANLNVTPELIYFSFALSNEYQFY